MKGLLLKDFYLFKSYCRNMLIADAIFLFAYFAGGRQGQAFLFFPCMTAGILPMTLLAYDEREKWNVYAQTLPVSGAQYVTEKYLVGLLALLVMLLLTFVALLMQPVGYWAVAALEAGAAIGLLAPSILLPFSFRFGVEKGRHFYYILLGLIYAGSMVFFSGGAASRAFESGVTLLLLAAVALYALSWRISVSLYERREL